jgi:hypothetical protein
LSGQGARGAHEEAVGLLLVAGGAPEAADIDVELEPIRLARNRAIVPRRPPKVSKVASRSRTHAVGEVLVENRGPEGRIRPTPVSRHRGTGRAADWSAAPQPESSLAVRSLINIPD